MPFLWKPYKSDVTNFIETLKAQKPTLEAEQRAGRPDEEVEVLECDQQSEQAEHRAFDDAEPVPHPFGVLWEDLPVR